MVSGEQDWYVSGVFNMSFLNLNDTFGDYLGRTGKVAKVNVSEDALVVSDAKIDDHSSRHEEGGADEITGIAGKLNAHASRHENTGGDEISVAGLSGVLADKQDPQAHSTRHENAGADEISVAGLSGVLADKQDPQDHAARHKDGGIDELDVSEFAGALGTANQVPKSDGAAVAWGDVDHSELTGVGASDHHAKYTDSEAVTAVNAETILSPAIGNNTNSCVRVQNPGGGAWLSRGSDQTGAIQVALPSVSNEMLTIVMRVYDYNADSPFTVVAGGYLYTVFPKWNNVFAQIVGTSPPDTSIRFGRNSDSSTYYIVIGDTSTVWTHPSLAITEVIVSFNATLTNWDDGWAISLVTSLPTNIDRHISDARVTPNPASINHNDLSAIGASDHHAKYTDAEAIRYTPLPPHRAKEQSPITTNGVTWTTVWEVPVYIAPGAQTAEWYVELQIGDDSTSVHARFGIGGNYSSEVTAGTDTVWTTRTTTLDVSALSGWKWLEIQLYTGNTTFAAKCRAFGFSYI